MSKTIYKFKLNVRHDEDMKDKYVLADVMIPRHHKVLKFGVQFDDIVLWAEVDTNDEPLLRTFFVVPTGGDVPSSTIMDYLDTVFMGEFVWHIYG
jgi:hypothetical protein